MELIALSRSIELIIGMLLGGLLCWLGFRLFETGVSGKASLSAEHGKLRFQLLNASPGLFFALFGCFLIFSGLSQTTKYHEKLLKDNQTMEVGLQKGTGKSIAVLQNDLTTFNHQLFEDGKKYYSDKNSEKAMDLFKAIVDGNDKYAESCDALAWLYVEQNKNPGKAVQLANAAVALEPDRVDFLHTLAKAYRADGKLEEGLQVLRKALSIDPSSKALQKELDDFKR